MGKKSIPISKSTGAVNKGAYDPMPLFPIFVLYVYILRMVKWATALSVLFFSLSDNSSYTFRTHTGWSHGTALEMLWHRVPLLYIPPKACLIYSLHWRYSISLIPSIVQSNLTYDFSSDYALSLYYIYQRAWLHLILRIWAHVRLRQVEFYIARKMFEIPTYLYTKKTTWIMTIVYQ